MMVRAYTKAERREKKAKFLAYLKKHPKVKMRDLPKGHYNTLRREYDCIMNKARKDAGIPAIRSRTTQPKEDRMKEELERFREYLKEREDKGMSVTSTDAIFDGFSRVMQIYGGINNLKKAAGKPDLVHGNDHRGKMRDAHRKVRVEHEPKVYRTFTRKRRGRAGR